MLSQHHRAYFNGSAAAHHKIVCTNCGIEGHVYRSCLSPVTSYGIIAVRGLRQIPLTGTSDTVAGIDSSTPIQFLLICRKDSLAFVEFIRGKYSLTEELYGKSASHTAGNSPHKCGESETYLGSLLRGMTMAEHVKLLTLSFADLWRSVWGDTSKNHKSDYEQSEKKFEVLRPQLAALTAKYATTWTEPEWGFPKGRRNPHETDIACALREFHEETGLRRENLDILQNTETIEENFMGSNRIHYCHKYYIAHCDLSGDLVLNKDNPHMAREVSDLQWLTLDQALAKIRPDNVEKREILLKVGRIIRNYCPVLTC